MGDVEGWDVLINDGDGNECSKVNEVNHGEGIDIANVGMDNLNIIYFKIINLDGQNKVGEANVDDNLDVFPLEGCCWICLSINKESKIASDITTDRSCLEKTNWVRLS